MGSLRLKEYLEKKGIDGIKVIPGAEYKTEYGDVIALGIEQEVKFSDFEELEREVRKQKGILLLPHPYKGHSNLEYVVSKVDMIEVFNSRTSDSDNEKALRLAKRHRMPVYYATDAHTSLSLGNCIVEFDKKGSLKDSILLSHIVPCNLKKSLFLEIVFSQFIKLLKVRNAKR